SSHADATRRLSGARKTFRYAAAYNAVVLHTIVVAVTATIRTLLRPSRSAQSTPAGTASPTENGAAYRMNGPMPWPTAAKYAIGNDAATSDWRSRRASSHRTPSNPTISNAGPSPHHNTFVNQ